MLAHSNYQGRVLSRPCPVHFAGFSSTTYQLQQAGWELSVEEDIRDMRMRLLARFEPAKLYMMAENTRWDYFKTDFNGPPPEFNVRHVSSHMSVILNETAMAFRPIDAIPQFVNTERKSIEDFGFFATPLTRTEEIIVEPASVASLLEQIRAMQAPELAAIRERNRRHVPGEIQQPIQRQQFHAQILSIAA